MSAWCCCCARATGEEVVASVLGAVPPPGSTVWLAADTAHALLFDADTGARIAGGRRARGACRVTLALQRI